MIGKDNFNESETNPWRDYKINFWGGHKKVRVLTASIDDFPICGHAG